MPHSARSLPPMRTSLAPHDSKARLRTATTRRSFMAKPCTPHPITRTGYATSVRQQSCQRLCNAQRVQSFKNKTRNVGGRGGLPSSFLLGFQRGHSLSRKRMAPLTRPLHGAGTEAALSGCKILARWRARKKRSTPAGAPFLHSPKSRTTLSQRSWSVS